MIVGIAKDFDEIRSIMTDYDIWKKININNLDKRDLLIPVDAIHVGGYIEGKLIALCTFNQFRDGLQAHPMIKKAFRAHGNEFIQQCINMIKCNIYAEFPKQRKDLINLVKKFNFEILSDKNTVLARLKK
jgi:hypothetical protein